MLLWIVSLMFCHVVSVPTKRGEGVHLCMNHFGNECWFKRFCFCLDLASGSQHMKIFGKECSFELFCLHFVLGSLSWLRGVTHWCTNLFGKECWFGSFWFGFVLGFCNGGGLLIGGWIIFERSVGLLLFSLGFDLASGFQLRRVANWGMNLFAKKISFELFCLGFILGFGPQLRVVTNWCIIYL